MSRRVSVAELLRLRAEVYEAWHHAISTRGPGRDELGFSYSELGAVALFMQGNARDPQWQPDAARAATRARQALAMAQTVALVN